MRLLTVLYAGLACFSACQGARLRSGGPQPVPVGVGGKLPAQQLSKLEQQYIQAVRARQAKPASVRRFAQLKAQRQAGLSGKRASITCPA